LREPCRANPQFQRRFLHGAIDRFVVCATEIVQFQRHNLYSMRFAAGATRKYRRHGNVVDMGYGLPFRAGSSAC
jgi:hypothetical protein